MVIEATSDDATQVPVKMMCILMDKRLVSVVGGRSYVLAYRQLVETTPNEPRKKPDDGWKQQFGSEGQWNLQPGVYRLIGLDEAGQPAIIRHVCGDDPSGTLYIGAGSTLMYRVSHLVKQHHPSFTSHPHKPLPPRMASTYPAQRLAMSWIIAWGEKSGSGGRRDG